MSVNDSEGNILKIGNKLVDKWYSRHNYKENWGVGTITNITKTRIYVNFPDSRDKKYVNTVYDLPHIKNFTLKYDRRLDSTKNWINYCKNQ